VTSNVHQNKRYSTEKALPIVDLPNRLRLISFYLFSLRSARSRKRSNGALLQYLQFNICGMPNRMEKFCRRSLCFLFSLSLSDGLYSILLKDRIGYYVKSIEM